MEFFNSTNWRLCMSMHEKSSISYLAGSQRTTLYRIIGIPWLCPLSQLHWPGPSHKARQLAWKYSRGASWPNYFLYKSLMSLTSIPIYILVMMPWINIICMCTGFCFAHIWQHPLSAV
jgi:hypothetical protein